MAKSVALFFASVAFVVIIVNLFINVLPIGVAEPMYILKTSLFAAFVFGLIGFYIGRVFEEGKEVADSGEVTTEEKDKELLLDDILVYDIGVHLKPKPNDGEEKKEETDGK